MSKLFEVSDLAALRGEDVSNVRALVVMVDGLRHEVLSLRVAVGQVLGHGTITHVDLFLVARFRVVLGPL